MSQNLFFMACMHFWGLLGSIGLWVSLSALSHRLLYTWTEDWILFFQILYQQCQKNMVLLSFVDIQKICIFTKFGGCSSKIEPATPILILKFKRAWQTQFFSHTLQILVNDKFFIGHQMIFHSIFCVSNGKAEIWEKLFFLFLSSPQVVAFLKFQLSC